MQAGLLGSALKNIETAWPELHAQIEECVRIFGYLPDAAFRSCSAARYSGIVYLGNMDESLLDLEESIVHETGHQVLYQLGEMTRLTSRRHRSRPTTCCRGPARVVISSASCMPITSTPYWSSTTGAEQTWMDGKRPNAGAARY